MNTTPNFEVLSLQGSRRSGVEASPKRGDAQVARTPFLPPFYNRPADFDGTLKKSRYSQVRLLHDLGNHNGRQLRCLGGNEAPMSKDIQIQTFLERALMDLERIEREASIAGGELSVLACLADMTADEVREQLEFIKQTSRAPNAITKLSSPSSTAWMTSVR